MPLPPVSSDLVEDARLETVVTADYTEHVLPSVSEDGKLVHRQERWIRDSHSVLGFGAFGVVYRERCGANLRAVKQVKKSVFSDEKINYAAEVEAVTKFSHEKYNHRFVKSYGWFDYGDSIYIAMEYMDNGDLQRYLTRPLPEHEAQLITSQVLEGLAYMHTNGFVHRDLKPSNIMVVKLRPQWWVKIADFGITKRKRHDLSIQHTHRRGTMGYAAPEILGILGPGPRTESVGSSTFAVDMWSLGACAYKLLTNETIFTNLRYLERYTKAHLEFPTVDFEKNTVTADGRDFVTNLMAPQPRRRLSAAQAAKHAWIVAPICSMERYSGF
ncbi:protein kinase-like domain-containing protein [Xylariomycetidae sp. FL2044]|nr:protein kinase-like domain-containing protein [Xylariomycetidae sp. FL2044]